MIKGKDIKKSFEGKVVLDNATFHVPAGSVYGLVGPNGAGKSTLIRHIVGIFRSDEGEIFVNGEPVYENTNVKNKIAYIPDNIFYFRQSTLDDMEKYYEGIYDSFDRDFFYDNLERFPAIKRNMNMRRMSKGMQKQATFLLATACRPQVMILDEPVDGLDPVMRKQIWNIMLDEVAKRNMTVLVSSHNLRELEDVCDHVGIMHKGKVMIERSLRELQQGISKIQIAYDPDMPKPEHGFEILHDSVLGKVHTLIIRGDQEEISAFYKKMSPLVFDILPLTLEEVFIYEMGSVNYEVTDILG